MDSANQVRAAQVCTVARPGATSRVNSPARGGNALGASAAQVAVEQQETSTDTDLIDVDAGIGFVLSDYIRTLRRDRVTFLAMHPRYIMHLAGEGRPLDLIESCCKVLSAFDKAVKAGIASGYPLDAAEIEGWRTSLLHSLWSRQAEFPGHVPLQRACTALGTLIEYAVAGGAQRSEDAARGDTHYGPEAELEQLLDHHTACMALVVSRYEPPRPDAVVSALRELCEAQRGGWPAELLLHAFRTLIEDIGSERERIGIAYHGGRGWLSLDAAQTTLDLLDGLEQIACTVLRQTIGEAASMAAQDAEPDPSPPRREPAARIGFAAMSYVAECSGRRLPSPHGDPVEQHLFPYSVGNLPPAIRLAREYCSLLLGGIRYGCTWDEEVLQGLADQLRLDLASMHRSTVAGGAPAEPARRLHERLLEVAQDVTRSAFAASREIVASGVELPAFDASAALADEMRSFKSLTSAEAALHYAGAVNRIAQLGLEVSHLAAGLPSPSGATTDQLRRRQAELLDWFDSQLQACFQPRPDRDEHSAPGWALPDVRLIESLTSILLLVTRDLRNPRLGAD